MLNVEQITIRHVSDTYWTRTSQETEKWQE